MQKNRTVLDDSSHMGSKHSVDGAYGALMDLCKV